MKNFPTLRDWIDDLAENDLLTIAKPGLSLNFELAALAHRLDGERATFFPNPGGHGIPVVSGIMSNRPWIARAMGVDEKGILKKYQEAVSAPLPCKVIPQSNAKVQEVIHAGPIDLAALLPAPIHNEHDGGAYITAGLLISANPKTGKQNVSINRCQLQGGNKLGVSVSSRDTGAFLAESEKQGKPMPITIVIGVDVMTLLASQALVGQDQDELEVAGALHGQPLEVVKSITNDLMIPAHAEIAIEGFFVPGVRELEGPFGEFTQYYGPKGERFVIEVTTVTHRKSPLFHTIIGGGTEHLMLGAVPREASFLTNMQRVFPNVLNVHLPKGGVGRYHLIVQIKKIYEGSAKNIIFSALSMHHDVKLVIVVDEDIDIFNAAEVEWAIATRFQADKDMVLESNCRASKLDPTSRGGIGSKLGIDATKPLDAQPEQFLRIKVPGAAELNLDEVTQKVNSKKWRENLVS